MLQLCTLGHELSLFETEGWPLFTLILQKRHFQAVLRLLLDLMPGTHTSPPMDVYWPLRVGNENEKNSCC